MSLGRKSQEPRRRERESVCGVAGNAGILGDARRRSAFHPGSHARHTEIRPDAREAAQRFYKQQVAERIPSTYLEFPAITKDGREIWFGQRVQLRLAGERIIGVEAILKIDPSRTEELSPILAEALGSRSRRIRHHVVRTLGNIPDAGRRAVPELINAFDDEDEIVRTEALNSLELLGSTAAPAVPYRKISNTK